MSADDPLSVALECAARGWHVFPCKADKRPMTRNGFLDATTEEAKLREWWGKRPAALVGIATGASGLAVVDLDCKDGAPGLDEWHGIVAELGAELEATTLVETPSGGMHVYYRANGHKVGSTASKLAPGIDTRAEGGYVIGAGSPGYLYVEEHGPDALATLPPALAERLAYAKSQPADRTPDAPIPQGQRNSTLASLSGTMQRRGMAAEAIFAALMAENLARCQPPLPEDEVRRIADSIGRYPPAKTPPDAAFHLTELGNAERLATRHAGSVFAVRGADELRAYDPARGIYTTDHGLLVRYAIDVVRSMYTEAADGLTDAAKDLRRHAERSEAKRALDAMLSLAKAQPALEAEPEDFDADPELLNTQSGVVDLRTDDLRPHDPKYRMTKIAAAYTPGAPAPMWDGFLARIFEGDAELIAFMQRLFGYALTGHTGEQIFAIFFGAGANGKSVLVDTWQAALGDYAGTAAMSTFLSHRHDAVRTDLATLNGRRLVSTSESKPGQLIDAATIKVLTSKHVTCRFNYQRGEFTYTPQYLVILDTNYKPQVQCDDYAIKRRVLLVPFGVLIPSAEQDKKLTEKLIAAELPGILAWGVAGAVDYLAHGLCVPERVRAATDAYRAEMDALHQFWGEWLMFGHPEKWTTAEALRDALTAWARENGVEHKDLPKGSEWGRQLRERGARPDKKKVAGKTVSVWFGVQIVGADVQEELI